MEHFLQKKVLLYFFLRFLKLGLEFHYYQDIQQQILIADVLMFESHLGQRDLSHNKQINFYLQILPTKLCLNQ